MRLAECTQLQNNLYEQIIKETCLAAFLDLITTKLPFFVGLDIANIAGLVEVEFLKASKTYFWNGMSLATGSVKVRLHNELIKKTMQTY